MSKASRMKPVRVGRNIYLAEKLRLELRLLIVLGLSRSPQSVKELAFLLYPTADSGCIADLYTSLIFMRRLGLVMLKPSRTLTEAARALRAARLIATRLRGASVRCNPHPARFILTPKGNRMFNGFLDVIADRKVRTATFTPASRNGNESL